METSLITVSLEDLTIKNFELYIDGLVQDYSNPSVLAMGLLQSYTKLSISYNTISISNANLMCIPIMPTFVSPSCQPSYPTHRGHITP